MGIKEFEEHLQDEAVEAYFASLELETTDAWTLFKLLDDDESHAIDAEEFVMGFLRLKGSARAIDVARLSHENKFLMNHLTKFMRYTEEQFDLLLGISSPTSRDNYDDDVDASCKCTQ